MTEPIQSFPELHARSAFAFLRAASTPETLVKRAAALGLPALAICDRDNLAGAVRLFSAARAQGLKPLIGAELTLEDGTVLPVLADSRPGYRNLCRLLSRAKLRSPKNESRVAWDELPEFASGLVALTGDEEGPVRSALARGDLSGAEQAARRLVQIFGPAQTFVEIQRHLRREEKWVNARLVELAETLRLPLLASNGPCHSEPAQRMAFDVFTCARLHTQLDSAGARLSPNAERHLKSDAEMRALFPDLPEAIENAVRLADRLQFSLDDLGYEFPRYPVSQGETMDSRLRRETLEGARRRYGHPSLEVLRQLDRELRLIEQLGFAGYFLCVWDIIEFCRKEGILVQGRGSAANSAVCYVLGITAVDPIKGQLLFERFLSEGRKGWPDIDLDLPSGDRREKVIQHVYDKYTRRGAAMTANVITFRGRLAAREIGKALGFPEDVLARFSSLFGQGDYPHTLAFTEQMRQAGLTVSNPRAATFLRVFQQLHGLPRHLGQHSGGMVICEGELDSVVPLENSSMPDRSIVQWDKDDCDDLGIVKVDLLGLGMMAVLQETIELCQARGRPVDLAHLPQDDPATYRMMQQADTIGVFQIESRAQMATLPRMKPACFYDVAIEVAIIRPGPIEGGLMHPFLARREGLEPVTYLDERLRPILERTLGICLFQEQVLKVAMVMADFSPSEADELRRALGFKRSDERLLRVEARLRAAMAARQAAPETIEAVVTMTRSFALYGFPESHAVSFALLAYASTWLKCHRAEEFLAALLNNQPMGFYAPATLVADARRHGVRVRPVCVRQSGELCSVEEVRNEATGGATAAVRLGLNQVVGLKRQQVQRLVAARVERPFASLGDLRGRVPLSPEELRQLARIGALNALCGHRRAALWEVELPAPEQDLFTWNTARDPRKASPGPDPSLSPLAAMSPTERTSADYETLRLTTGPHPMSYLRPHLPGVHTAAQMYGTRDKEHVVIAGNVICRQRPGTAHGFVFISLEDETGISNAIVAPPLYERQRLVIVQEPYLRITGRVSRRKGPPLVQARKIERLDLPEFEQLAAARSHDFH